MKKLLLLLSLCLSSVSQAQTFASVNAEFATGVNGASDMHGYLFTVGHKANANIVVDANAETLVANSTNATINRLEAGATWLVPNTTILTPYVRTALGSKTASSNQFNYYSVEPGLRAKLGPGAIRLGWRYRDSVESGYTDLSRTWRLGYVLPMSNSIDLNVAYEQSRGNMSYNGYMTGLVIKF